MRAKLYAVCGGLLLGSGGFSARAEDLLLASGADEWRQLSIEQLMDLEVTTVSRRPQALSSAPSAISVLTQEDIRRSAALHLPDVLRVAPGLQVAQFSQGSYAISARGFNNLAANKLQVLRDGRELYTPLLSGVFWEVQDVMLEDLERIEVVRGPGAAMWGANAVNGVINIISKPAQDTQGTLVTGGGGSQDLGFGGVRYGGKLSENTFYRVYGKYNRRAESVTASGGDASDGSHFGMGGFRLDSTPAPDNLLTAQGDLFHSQFDLANPDNGIHAGGNLMGRWTRTFSESSELQTQIYYDRNERRIPGQFEEDRNIYDADLQHRFALGERHIIIWGLNYRVTTDKTGNSGTFQFSPVSRSIQRGGGFIQDEIALIEDRLAWTIGSKLEHNDYTGFEFQPSTRLAWTMTERQTLWGAVSRAVRTPTRVENDLQFRVNPFGGPVIISGNPDFESEDLLAWELGYRVQPHATVTFDISAFYNIYDNLRTQEPTPPVGIPYLVENEMEGDAYGVELGAKYQPQPWFLLQASYTYLDTQLELKPGSMDLSNTAGEGNDPHHMAKVRAGFNLGRNVELDFIARYVDRLPNPPVPSYIGFDIRLGWSPTENLEFEIAGRNLLDNQHREFGNPGPAAPEVERSVYAKATWRF